MAIIAISAYSTPSKPVVMFRLDDVQSWWCEDIAQTVVHQFLSANVPINLGVIGKNLDQSSSMVSFLQSLSGNPLVEFSSHSQKHETFAGQTQTWQEYDLQESISTIHSVTGISPNSFIPPFNAYDDVTFDALNNVGMNIMSGECVWYPEGSEYYGTPVYCPDGSDVVAPNIMVDGVYSLPTGAVLGGLDYWTDYLLPPSLSSALGWINAQIERQGFSVVMLHPVEFATSTDCSVQNTHKLAALQRLLMYGQQHWDIRTFTDGAMQISSQVPTPSPSIPPTTKHPSVSPSPTPSPTPTRPKVAFRLENVQAWWCEDVFQAVVNEFISYNLPLTIGFIGSYLDQSASMVSYLQSIAGNPLIDYASNSLEFESFEGKTLSWQEDDLKQSKSIIESVVSGYAVSFIPPFNRYDHNTITAMKNQAYDLISSKCNWNRQTSPNAGTPIDCTEGDDVVAPNIIMDGVYHLPAGAVMGDDLYWSDPSRPASLEYSLSWIESQLANQGFSVVRLQPVEFSGDSTCSTVNADKIDVLRELLNYTACHYNSFNLQGLADALTQDMGTFAPTPAATLNPSALPTYSPTHAPAPTLTLMEDFDSLAKWEEHIDGETGIVSLTPASSKEEGYVSFDLSYCPTCYSSQIKLASHLRSLVIPDNEGVHWIGFRMRIPGSWEHDGISELAYLMELMRGDRVDDTHPLLALAMYKGTKLYIQSCGAELPTDAPTCQHQEVYDVKKNVWTNWVIRINLNCDKNKVGSVEVWVDGESVFNKRPRFTSFCDENPPYVKLGISNVAWRRKEESPTLCPAGFDGGYFNERCYKFISAKDDWNDAKATCEARGGWLATIDDKDTYEYIESTFNPTQTSIFWIGYSDMAHEKNWVWENGESTGYTMWDSGEPNNYYGKSDCAIIYSNGKMRDRVCSDKYDFLCETYSNEASEETEISLSCPEGFEGGYHDGFCYKISSDKEKWDDAKDECEEAGGWLATIPDESTYKYITKTFGVGARGTYWLGYNDIAHEGSWVYDHDGSTGYALWDRYEPSGGSSDCAIVYCGSKMRDRKCSDKNYFLCQTKAVEPTPRDDDGDVGSCCSSEFSSGYYDNKCYGFVSAKDDWKDAKATCEARGGWLATIPDEDTYKYIERMFNPRSTCTFWLGYNDIDHEGTWEWENGLSVGYTDWDKGEPNNSGGRSDCAILYGTGKMRDRQCTDKYQFLCQSDATCPSNDDSPTETGGYSVQFSDLNVGNDDSCYNEVYTGDISSRTCTHVYSDTSSDTSSTSTESSGSSSDHELLLGTFVLLTILVVAILVAGLYVLRRNSRDDGNNPDPSRRSSRLPSTPFVTVESGLSRSSKDRKSSFTTDNIMTKSPYQFEQFKNPVHEDEEHL
eukprot:CAMPEP_0185024902 /NCGR_PEP_ID=MMETSP1103-20130426/8059_1 /TAXON_ID=36769 /ORGANISM="Paraphysomonas bandaiensis, Strain Caron Lab Isolate" /LENGTH=1367 /DNA_ID=CAMNT_0027557985 /DNA_START=157 /DNA_END=4260 /DNA_ORIENTATION=+